MPFTINGIGTSYYGRRDVASSVETCGFCGQRATLSNYRTTHWFVVFYLPVIPLGKMQIFLDCSRCRKHRVMPSADWQRIQSTAIEGAKSAADAAPDDALPAINLLGVLFCCFRRQEAADLARALHDRFPKHSQAQLAAAECLQACGAPAEAERAWLTALELDHDNLPAKRAVALSLLAKNEPETALRLIATPPRLEAAQDPKLFAQLGEALAAAGRHDQALAAFQQALSAAPALSGDASFRRSMESAERAAGVDRSALPRLSWLRRHRAALVAAVILAVASLPIVWNQYVAGHQTLHIVNGFAVPVSIRLEDGSQLTAPARAHITASIAEGEHEATVSAGGRRLEGGRFEVSASVLDHFLGDPVFVLNPGRGATLLWEEAVYAPAARAGRGPLPLQQSRYLLGPLFETFPAVDYAFREFPRKIELNGGFATKTRVIMAPQEITLIVEAPPAVASAPDRMRLAETHLRVTPGDARLRQAYRNASDQAGQREHAEKFLTELAGR